MEVVINRYTVDTTHRRWQNIQRPRISLLDQYFTFVTLPVIPGCIMPKLNYTSTVSFSESILNILEMHILFFSIISFEKKPQLIYIALTQSFIQHLLSCV